MSWHINSIKTYDLNGTYTRVLTMLVLVTLIGLTHNVGIYYLNWTYTPSPDNFGTYLYLKRTYTPILIILVIYITYLDLHSNDQDSSVSQIKVINTNIVRTRVGVQLR